MRNFLIVISGPSGSGKTCVCDAVLERIPKLSYSISYTTRQPRKDEVDGRDYFFVAKEEFRDKIEAGDFLEYAKVHNNWYGTSHSFIKDRFAHNHNVIMDIDVQGAKEIISNRIDCVTIFLLPPSISILRKRLENRATDTREIIELRLENAAKEIKEVDNYQYLIINDDLEKTVAEVQSVITAEKNKVVRYISLEKSFYGG